ncbi:hypothetical protein ACIGO9_29815 [Nocardia asteroides]|uniref:hypothetical protein n=1 Tax=Nocardia asteroides TaxID=1824 RepID=UPI0037CB1FAE
MSFERYTCPLCKTRDGEWDWEGPGTTASKTGHCSACFGIRCSAPYCNKPDCLTGGHTSEKTRAINYTDHAATGAEPLYQCTRCREVLTAPEWQFNNACRSAWQDCALNGWLVATRMHHARQYFTATSDRAIASYCGYVWTVETLRRHITIDNSRPLAPRR